MSSILVKGIKLPATEDKLIIHFQKKRNSGGDVESVKYPLTPNKNSCALVNFEEEATADSVLTQKQIFNGAELKITKEYQLFLKASVTLNSKLIVNKLGYANEKELIDFLQKYSDNLEVSSSVDGLIVSACSWYELEGLRETLVTELNKHKTKGSSNDKSSGKEKKKLQSKRKADGQDGLSPSKTTLTATNSHQEDLSASKSSASPPEMLHEPKSDEPSSSPSGMKNCDAVTFTADRDVMEYLFKFHRSQITNIEVSTKCSFSIEPDGPDYSLVTCAREHSDVVGDPSEAERRLLKLFNDVQTDQHFQHEIHAFGADADAEKILVAVIASTRENFRSVFVRLRKSEEDEDHGCPPSVVFVSTCPDQVSKTLEWFRSLYHRYASLDLVDVDAGCFGFIKKTQPLSMLGFERRAATRVIELRDNDDKLWVLLDPQSGNKPSEQDIIRFKSFIKSYDMMHEVLITEYDGRFLSSELTKKIDAFQRPFKNVFLHIIECYAESGTLHVGLTYSQNESNNLAELREEFAKLDFLV